MLQCSRLSAQLTRSCMSSGRRCLTCDTTNPFLKAFRSSCTMSFHCFCELEHACSAQWWIHVITYVCTKVLLTLTLKIGDCLSIALNQDPPGTFTCTSWLGNWCALLLLSSDGNKALLQPSFLCRYLAGHGDSWELSPPTRGLSHQVNLQATAGLSACG